MEPALSGTDHGIERRRLAASPSTWEIRNTRLLPSMREEVASTTTSATIGSMTRGLGAPAAVSIPESSAPTRTSATRSSSEAFEELAALESLVQREGACSLPGVSIAYDVFLPIMMRAVARGYVRQEHAEFVADGLRWGFDLGVDVSKMRGKRLYKNYPTALVARDAVTRAVRKRVETFKTYKLFKFKEEDRHLLPWPDWRVFPMGAVAKPMEPGEMRPYSDHTKTGMKSATDVEFFRHTLTATEDIARFLKHAYYMRVSDIDAAFPLLPVRPRLWRYLMFRWYDVEYIADSEDMCLYVHVCGDFGSAGMPGTFKIFFSDVVKGMASSELVLTLPAPVHVDDISLIGAIQEMVDKEGKAFSSFLKMLGIYIKEIKDRAAAQVQLALGFWWNSIDRTRTLVERKHQAYISMLDEFEKRRSLTLKDRQQEARAAAAPAEASHVRRSRTRPLHRPPRVPIRREGLLRRQQGEGLLVRPPAALRVDCVHVECDSALAILLGEPSDLRADVEARGPELRLRHLRHGLCSTQVCTPFEEGPRAGGRLSVIHGEQLERLPYRRGRHEHHHHTSDRVRTHNCRINDNSNNNPRERDQRRETSEGEDHSV